MPQGDSRIKAQGGVKLLNRLHRPVRVLISAAKQNVCKCTVWFDFDCTFQFVSCRGILILVEKHQREVEMNFGFRSVELFGVTQGLQSSGILPALKIDQSHPVLKLRIIGPMRDGLTTQFCCFVQGPGLQIAQQKSTIRVQIFRRQLPRFLKILNSALDISAIKGGLAVSQQDLHLRRRLRIKQTQDKRGQNRRPDRPSCHLRHRTVRACSTLQDSQPNRNSCGELAQCSENAFTLPRMKSLRSTASFFPHPQWLDATSQGRERLDAANRYGPYTAIVAANPADNQRRPDKQPIRHLEN